jgi:hypothetical protein
MLSIIVLALSFMLDHLRGVLRRYGVASAKLLPPYIAILFTAFLVSVINASTCKAYNP